MGACSTKSVDKDEGEEISEGKALSPFVHIQPAHRRLRKNPFGMKPSTKSQPNWRSAISNLEFDDETGYNKALEELQLAEKAEAFDAGMTASSVDVEKLAAELVRKIRLYDWDHTYGPAHDAHGHPTGKRTQGEHFLGNVDLINKTELFKVARRMPKGAHLHIHFNACLPAKFLLRQARDVDAMYIRSTLPLTTPENWAASRISFMVLTRHEATYEKDTEGNEHYLGLGNVWDSRYPSNRWMSYKDFQRTFHYTYQHGHGSMWREGAETWLENRLYISEDEALKRREEAEIWLEEKMHISEEEAHNTHQTSRG